MENWRESGTALVLIVLIPILSSIYLALKIHKKRNKEHTFFATFKLNAEGLLAQGWFQVIATSGVFYTLIFLYIAAGNRKISLTSDGLKIFISQAQMPLGILSAMALLILLVSRVHSSLQTQKQIEETQKKNDIDLYILQKQDFTNNINEQFIFLNKKQYFMHPDAKISSNLFDKVKVKDKETGAYITNQKFLSEMLKELHNLQRITLDIVNIKNEMKLAIALSDFPIKFYYMMSKLGLLIYEKEVKTHEKIVRFTYEDTLYRLIIRNKGALNLINMYFYIFGILTIILDNLDYEDETHDYLFNIKSNNSLIPKEHNKDEIKEINIKLNASIESLRTKF